MFKGESDGPTGPALDAANWLRNEDSQCFEERFSRLIWLTERLPGEEYWTFPGGLMAKSLFEETRYCFVYGQYLAATVLGLAYIERTLSALFYAAGRNDLERAGLGDLLKEALSEGLIDSSDFQHLDRIRTTRNSYAHFRKPSSEKGIEFRSIIAGEAPYAITDQDATNVMSATLRMVATTSV